MTVTEQDLIELAQTLRSEFAEDQTALLQEISVRITEAHNRTAGITAEDVEAMITASLAGLPSAPDPGISASDVQQMITESLPEEVPPGLTKADVETMISVIPPYDDDEIKKRILRLRVFANGLADRIGAPRIED